MCFGYCLLARNTETYPDPRLQDFRRREEAQESAGRAEGRPGGRNLGRVGTSFWLLSMSSINDVKMCIFI